MASRPIITGVAHVGWAVRDHAPILATLQSFGFELRSTERTLDGSMSRILDAERVAVEVLSPAAGDGSLSRYLDNRGEGLHHVCFTVSSVELATRFAFSMGLRLVSDTPSQDSDGLRVFLHPKTMFGALIGLVEPYASREGAEGGES